MRKLSCFIRDLLGHDAGNVAILFAICSPILILGVGGGIDLARTYAASQELTQVANLGCQFASRPSMIQIASQSGGGPTYVSKVNSYIAASLTSQHFAFTQSNGSPFSYTPNGPANVTLNSTVPTVFSQIVHVTTIPITATAHCYDTPSAVPQIVPNGNSTFLVQEGFENTAICPSGFCFVNPSGGIGTVSTPISSASTAASYTGATGGVWHTTGYCLEVDHVGIIKSTVAEGSFSAELDCDNGSNTAGNSSISTEIYLPAGAYELRYNYVARVDYPHYDPTYICGTTASDVSWANDTYSPTGPVTNALRTNQINVYLDKDTTGSPPLHTTILGSQQLAGSNLIDVCVYAQNWIERSVRINVTTAGYYWLSFAADGQSDSYGGQLDNIRFCNGTCTGSVQDNFPSAWTTTPKLFEDTFESPVYLPNNPNASTLGNLNVSLGTSGASSGWPGLSASGWATAPYNQMDYILAGAAQGSQNIELDASNPQPSNRAISRSFLLDPGYYEIDYNYISGAIFPGNTGASSVRCNTAPNASTVAGYANPGSASANIRYPAATMTVNIDTNLVGLFVSHGQLISTPIGGGALNSQTSYLNPDGSTSTTPTASPSAISISNYNASQSNPLVDACFYAPIWQTRTAYIQITKPAYYWLTFAALGTVDNVGGDIDDVKLKAVGSLYGAAPGTYVTIPVPSPQPSSSYTNGGAFTGFSIVADPLTAPSP